MKKNNLKKLFYFRFAPNLDWLRIVPRFTYQQLQRHPSGDFHHQYIKSEAMNLQRL